MSTPATPPPAATPGSPSVVTRLRVVRGGALRVSAARADAPRVDAPRVDTPDLLLGWLQQLQKSVPVLRTAYLFDADAPPGARRVAALPECALLDAVGDDLAQQALDARRYLTQEPADVPGRRILAIPMVFAGLPRVALVAMCDRPARASVTADLRPLFEAMNWLKLLRQQPATPAATGSADAATVQATPAAGAAPTQPALDLLACALEQPRLHAAAAAVVRHLAASLGAARASIGLASGRRFEILAVSGSPGFDPATAQGHAIREAMVEAVTQGVPLCVPTPAADAGRETTAQRHLADAARAATVCTVPFGQRGTLGAVVLEWSGERPDLAEELPRWSAMLALLAPLLEAQREAGRGPLDRLAARLRALAQGIAGPRRPLLKLALGLGVLLLALAAFVPVAHRVDGEAVLRGSVQRVVLAPVDGFVATAPARPGDVVKAGATLATLDDQALKLEVVKRQSEYDQVLAEYREAMSLLDSARVTTLRAGLDRAGAELSLAEENLARSQIPAPIDGVVVSGDLSQSLGAPVQRGQTLFEIAPLETWRVSVQVDERDIGPVAAGQRGALRLEADPGRSLPLVVERVTPVARVDEGRNLFEVEARLVDAPADLRPGMQGIARIEVGEQRLLSAMGGGLADWLRLRWWALGLGGGT